jgi:transcription initiation factor IIE alpha subunit
MYENNILTGIPDKDIAKKVLDALVKQNIVCKKKKEHGWKYYLNMERYDKIKEIIKEKGKHSIIPILLMLY